MAKDKKHIDDLFKDQFKGGQLPLDGTEWDRLYADLHPGKKKRFAWWWWGLALAVVLGGAGLVYKLAQKEDVAVVENKDDSSTVSRSGQAEHRPGSNSVENSNSVANSNSVVNGNENSGTESINSNINHNENAKDNAGVNSNSVGSNANDVEGTGSNASPGSSSNSVDSKPNTTSGSTSASASTSTFEPLVFVKPFDKVEFDVIRLWPTAYDLGKFGPVYDLIEPMDSTRKWIDPYVGFSLGASNYTQQLSSDDNIYLDKRGLNESSAVLPNFSLDVGGEFKGLNFQSGVGYETKGQTNATRFIYVLYDSIPRRNTQGDTIGWAPWNYRDTTIDRRLDNPRYSYIVVPINVGKSFHLGYSDFTLDLGLNGSVQYLMQAKGFILSPELRPMNVQQLSGFNRLNLTYGGYLGMGYAVSDRLKLHLITRYNIDGRSMINNTGTQKMQGFGGSLSVQFKLKE